MSDSNLAASAAGRGNNLVCFAPPSASAVRPILRGVLERRSLALAPAEALEEWARVAAQVAGSGGLVAHARTPARLARLLGSPELKLIFSSPDTAHALVRRSALKPAELEGVLLLWPEAWGGDALAGEVLQEVPKEAQRILVSADPAGSAPLIDRYCWRAAVADLLGPAPSEPAPLLRSMPVAWTRRDEALLDLVEQLDPATLAIWVADEADRPVVEDALRASGSQAAVSSTAPSAASVVVAYDLPSPAGLRALAAAGEVVLLVPPGTEAYVARLAPQRKPLHAMGALGSAQAAQGRVRQSIAAVIERGPPAAAYFTIAPLLERHEATAVAAALYELWEEARALQPPPVAALPLASVKLWVGIGKRDSVTPHDLVAVLINEAGVSKEAIGKLDIRDAFTLVELSQAADPEAVAERLTGKTIRRRRLVARVDKGRVGRSRVTSGR
ncbi:MAG TPA: DbpA RNA binding domain-containing protein [Gemmatimonadales bacterium]|nr:DbpA RNA binding domain-containing protein [Gemmatimonadales bacterium]